MRRKYQISFLLIILTLLFKNSYCQQLPHYNHYFVNPYLYNPSTAGLNGLNALMIHKSQWTSIPGAPVVNTFSADGPFMNKKAGFGLLVSDDKRGVTKRTNVSGSFSYKVKFSDNTYFSFGASAMYINTRLLFNDVIVINADDPIVLDINAQKGIFDATAGLMFMHKDLQIGFAIPQSLASRVKFTDSRTNSIYQYKRYYLPSAAYKFMLISEKKISLNPLIMAMVIPGMPMQYDLNLTTDWQQVGWMGFSYRSSYGASVSAGIRIAEKLTIGYSYDINLGLENSYVGKSHEFLLGYRFNSSNKTDKKQKEQITKERNYGLKEQKDYIYHLIEDLFSKGPAKKEETKKDLNKIYNELEILKKMELRDEE